MDSSLKNSPLTDATEGASTVMLDSADTQCVWNGQSFAEGDMVECDGADYECCFGRWVKN